MGAGCRRPSLIRVWMIRSSWSLSRSLWFAHQRLSNWSGFSRPKWSCLNSVRLKSRIFQVKILAGVLFSAMWQALTPAIMTWWSFASLRRSKGLVKVSSSDIWTWWVRLCDGGCGWADSWLCGWLGIKFSTMGGSKQACGKRCCMVAHSSFNTLCLMGHKRAALRRHSRPIYDDHTGWNKPVSAKLSSRGLRTPDIRIHASSTTNSVQSWAFELFMVWIVKQLSHW